MDSQAERRHRGIVVGSPVTGDDFFDREQELAELIDLIRADAHVLVTAPRRIGKTSLLKETESRVGDEFAVLFVDVQSCAAEAEAVVKLSMVAREHRDTGQKVYDAFRNVLGSVTIG